MAFLASQAPWPLQLSPALPPWNPFRHQHRWLKAIRWASNVHEWPNHDSLAGNRTGFDVWDVTGNYVEKFPIFCDWYLGRRKLSVSETKGCEISSMSLEITGLLCSPCKNSPWHAGGFVHLHLWCRIVVHDTPVDVHSEGFFWVLSSRLLGWKIRRRARACTSGVRVCVRVTTKSKPLMKTHINYGCKMPPSAPQCQWSASIIELQYVKIRSPFFRTKHGGHFWGPKFRNPLFWVCWKVHLSHWEILGVQPINLTHINPNLRPFPQNLLWKNHLFSGTTSHCCLRRRVLSWNHGWHEPSFSCSWPGSKVPT